MKSGLEMGQGKNRETSQADSSPERPRGWATKREAGRVSDFFFFLDADITNIHLPWPSIRIPRPIVLSPGHCLHREEFVGSLKKRLHVPDSSV